MATLVFFRLGEWHRKVLDPHGGPYSLASITATDTRTTATAPDGLMLSYSRRTDGTGSWNLHVDSTQPVHVNGLAVDTGIRVLSDRDSITWGSGPGAWLSLEETARVEPFPGADEELRCPRCRQVLVPGCDAIRCLACGSWHHHSPAEDLDCWNYAPMCAACPQPTATGTEAGWSPEAL